MEKYKDIMTSILREFGLDGMKGSTEPDKWVRDMYDTRRDGTMIRKIASPDDLDGLTGEMDEFRLLCTGFIDEFTEHCMFPPTEWDKYLAINIRIWAEAVTNHIAIMMRWLPEIEKKRMARDFVTILLAKSGQEGFK